MVLILIMAMLMVLHNHNCVTGGLRGGGSKGGAPLPVKPVSIKGMVSYCFFTNGKPDFYGKDGLADCHGNEEPYITRNRKTRQTLLEISTVVAFYAAARNKYKLWCLI